jgi:hypothetical protein
MNKTIVRMAFALIALMVLFAASFAEGLKPGKGKKGGRYGVAEPAAMVLLGGGLASLGLYAIKKHKKK